MQDYWGALARVSLTPAFEQKRSIYTGKHSMNLNFKDHGAPSDSLPQASSISRTSLPKRPAKRVSLPVVNAVARIGDLTIIGFSGVITYMGSAMLHDQALSSRYFSAIAIAVFVSAAIFQWAGVYQGSFLFSRRRYVERVVGAWGMTSALLIVAAFSLQVSEYYARAWAVGWFTVATCLLIAARILITGLGRDWANQGRFADRTVIVGAGAQGVRLAQHLEQHGDVCTNIVGFVDDRSSRIAPDTLTHPFLGNIDELLKLVRENKVDQVFVALPWAAETRLRDIALEISTTPIRIHLAPDLVGFQFSDRSFSKVGSIPMLHLFDRPISGFDRVIKSMEDLILGSLLAVVALPVTALIAIAIKLDSPGPVFFKQKREGFNNNLINVWKFRSMRTDMTDENCATQTTKNDPRVTRVGLFLRKTSLDELPQLINVLTGSMSLVGPRPHATGTKSEGRLFEDVVDRYAARHRVKPGITGWAQVNGWRGETDTAEKIERRVEHDLYYIDNWSLFMDLKILGKTVNAIFKAENAY